MLDYKLILDTANLDDIEYGLKAWPVVGVTSNPSILKKEGNIDVYERLSAIKKLCGPSRSLHVQVVSDKTEDIISEAHFILEKLGKDTYIKIPVSTQGLPAIKSLAEEGVGVTATAIYSTMQGILAVLAGAEYLAIYYNRMENNCTNPDQVISEIRSFIDGSGSNAKILGASFKNIGQVTSAFAAGAQCVTVDPAIIKQALNMSSVSDAVKAFTKDFETIHGIGKTMKTI